MDVTNFISGLWSSQFAGKRRLRQCISIKVFEDRNWSRD